jgi:NADPH-dependent curcumin reductase CurA
VGEVVDSRATELKPGDFVQSMRGWRDLFVAPASELRRLEPGGQPLSMYLGALGVTGLTAWVGLKLIALQPGDRVFVSGAAGAVGSVAGQIAKQRGCFVVGSAGSEEKVDVLRREFGFDAAFNYKSGAVRDQLAALAPDGVDVYFDNVGGEQLEAALWSMRDHGRVAACGAISRYNEDAAVPGPRNMFLFVTRRLTMRGFIVTDHVRELKAFLTEVGPLVSSGRLRVRETIVEGLERAPQAFLDMLRGSNIGKMIVKL